VALNSRSPLMTRVVFDLKRRLPYRVDTTGQDRGEVVVVLGEAGGRTAAAAVSTVGTAPEPPRPGDRGGPVETARRHARAAPTVTPPAAPRPGLPSPPSAAPPGLPRPATEAPPAVASTRPARGRAPHPAGRRRRAPPAAEVVLSLPSTDLALAGGPYSVPISITNASRVSVVSLSITFNPAVLRVRSVQEGSSSGKGGHRRHLHAPDRRRSRAHRHLDDEVWLMRPGASGSGLIAAVLFDAVEPGTVTFTLGGSGDGSAGRSRPLVFSLRLGHPCVERGEAPQTLRAHLSGDRRAGEEAVPRDHRGFTFVELLVVSVLLLILASAAMPLARVTVQRQKEVELRRAPPRPGAGAIRPGTKDAVDPRPGASTGSADRKQEATRPRWRCWWRACRMANDASGRKLRFLRRIPFDPMYRRRPSGACGRTRTTRRRPPGAARMSTSVHSTSGGTALDGTKYRDW